MDGAHKILKAREKKKEELSLIMGCKKNDSFKNFPDLDDLENYILAMNKESLEMF